VRDDLELLDAWQAGDEDAGEALLGKYFEPLARFFRNKVMHGAEDLVQRTLLGCLEGHTRFRRESSFRTFLFSVARNVLLEHLRTQRRAQHRHTDFSVSSLFDLDPTPSQVIAHEQEEQILLEALRRLPVDLQLALELFYWEEMTIAELAVVLQIPAGTVKSRLFRARQQLREEIERQARSPALLRSTLTRLDAVERKAAARAG
jgi:RNA polymerase sigma factor (sigma-70 family)